MSIRVLLVAAMVVGLVASLVTIGSQAFFGDSEISQGNVAEAGVMDIQVNGLDDPIPQMVNYTSAGTGDMKPSRDLEPVVVAITNTGQNPGHLDLHYLNVGVVGGILSEPECTSQGGLFIAAGPDCLFTVPVPGFLPDTTPIPSGTICTVLGGTPLPNEATASSCEFLHSGPQGSLFDVTNINDVFTVDVHNIIVGINGPAACEVLGGTFFPLPSPGVCAENPPIVFPTFLGPAAPGGGIESLCIELGAIALTQQRDILLTFHLNGSAGDEYQGDIITFDIEFTLHQDNDPNPHSDTPGTQCGTNDPLPTPAP